MAKSKGPYFEFFLQRNGGSIEFLFAPGNSSRQVFNETKDALISIFHDQYGVSSKDFIREVELPDGTPSVAIYQSKVLPVFRVILGTRAFSDFKIRVKGLDRNGVEKEKILVNPVQAQEAKEIIPYFNKNNNDLTTKRRK
jgi:hypothetical protein